MPSIQTFFVPIVFSSAEGALTLHPYIVERDQVERYRLGRFVPIADSEAPDPWGYEEAVPATVEAQEVSAGDEGEPEIVEESHA